jgi:ADP-heptose:LPS heptosyltransferase
MKTLLRRLILALVYLLGASGAYTTRRRSKNRATSVPRILLIRPDHLGDLVMTTPVLQALREQAPNAHITMMVGPWSSAVVEHHPALNQLLTCPFPGFQRATQKPLEPYRVLFKMARQLQHERYDLAINLRPDFWWGAALLYLARIPHRIGYAIAPNTPFLTQALPFPPAEHATISSLRLTSTGLQTLGYPPLIEPYTPTRYPLHFKPTAEEQQWITQYLLNAGIGQADPVVVIHPGTGGDVKLWRTEAWSQIANTLMTNKMLSLPAKIVLTGSPKERPMLEQIAQGMTVAPLLMTDMTVGQLAALLARAQLVLGVDNGPLHLATAQDTPTLRLFGPTDTHIFGPWGSPERHIIIASTQKCPTCPTLPCGRLDFRPEELPLHPCVRVITEQQVEQAIAKIVENTNLYPIS